MRASDASAKALIFSSFQATIEQLQEALPGWGYSFRFINGERLVHIKSCKQFLSLLPGWGCSFRFINGELLQLVRLRLDASLLLPTLLLLLLRHSFNIICGEPLVHVCSCFI
jgi:hypothetical protein